METTGPALWLIVLTIGALALAAAMPYGALRNRGRKPVEKVITEAATREEYRKEDEEAVSPAASDPPARPSDR